MPISNHFSTKESIELCDFVEYAKKRTNMKSTESIFLLGEQLTMLGNNRSFLSDFFSNFIIKNCVSDPLSNIISQSIVLARSDDFYVRANFWLPEEDMTESESLLFAYNQAHDHNFDLLTIAYCGDGYITDGYEYNYDQVAGYIGEVVDIHPLGSYKHVCGDIFLYVCNKDIHIQRPPHNPSITINVIPTVNQNGLRDQYFFDIDYVDSTTAKITHYPTTIIENRKNLFEIARHFANDNIEQLFIDIAKKHECNRTRYEALVSLKKCNINEHNSLCEKFKDDEALIMKHYANSVLIG